MNERRRSALRRPVSPTARLGWLCTNDLNDGVIEITPGVWHCRSCFADLQQARSALAAVVASSSTRTARRVEGEVSRVAGVVGPERVHSTGDPAVPLAGAVVAGASSLTVGGARQPMTEVAA